MQVLGQVRAFAWSSFDLPKARNQQEEKRGTGGQDEEGTGGGEGTGGEGEEGTANSRRRARKEVDKQARGRGGATGAAV